MYRFAILLLYVNLTYFLSFLSNLRYNISINKTVGSVYRPHCYLGR